MTLADELTEVVAAVRLELAEAFHADSYELVRTLREEALDGSWTQRADAVVERGRCAVLDGDELGGDEADSHVITGLSPYRCELPVGTIAETGDLVRVNGREYLVDDVKRGGNHRLFAVAGLRSRARQG